MDEKKLKILDLVLKYEPYDLIESGDKRAEYREIKPYWCKRIKGMARHCIYSLPSSVEGERICQMSGATCTSGNTIKYNAIRVRRGYTKKSMLFELESMQTDYGKTEWLAPDDKPVFILNLGERLE